MLTKLELGKLSLSGLSLGGVYTSILCPELSVIFDAGISPRSFVGARYLLLSHGHADHIGSLPSVIGLRGLAQLPAPTTYVPEEIVGDLREAVRLFNTNQRRIIEVDIRGVLPGQELHLGGDLYAQAFRTIHSVPSLGYSLFRKVRKLRARYLNLSGEVIEGMRREGADIFEWVQRSEISYATDTLIDVLDETPSLYSAKVLVLECTFLDDLKSKSEARQKSHVHLDEIIERADLFENEHLVLIHFSQSYQPADVHRVLEQRLPKQLKERVRVLAPRAGVWPG